jgi:hypothetical protein
MADVLAEGPVDDTVDQDLEGSHMNGEIGYIVAVKGMREFLLRRDENERVESADGPAPGAASRTSPDVGELVRIGRGPRPIVAVVSGVARSLHEELQPYIPSEYQSKYLPAGEDFRDSYLTLHAVGELPEEGATGDALVEDAFCVSRVPALSDPVVPLTRQEVVRFHTSGNALSLGYLQDLSHGVEPEVLLRLLDLVEAAARDGGFATDAGLGVKFKAVRRHIVKGVMR